VGVGVKGTVKREERQVGRGMIEAMEQSACCVLGEMLEGEGLKRGAIPCASLHLSRRDAASEGGVFQGETTRWAGKKGSEGRDGLY